MDRGRLRIYIGVAVGVGKTCALVAEAERRAQRGTDVVIGAVQGHGRPRTENAIDRLEARLAHPAIDRRVPVDSFSGPRRDLDVEAIIDQRPALVLVDDLAVVNRSASRNRFRWEDVDELLDAGIDVISAINVEHLESLADLVSEITGARVASSVPDAFVRSADQVELIDMDPVALRRRLAHGNIVRADQLSLSASQYFRVDTLAALRELALLWVADRVDDDVRQLLRDRGAGGPVETKTRVVVAMTGSPGGDILIRRGARMSDRLNGELVGVHVNPPGPLTETDPSLEVNRKILTSLGGRFVQIAGDDVAATLVAFVRAENATQLVIGGSNRSRLDRLVHGSVVSRILDSSEGIDVHVIAALPQPAQTARRRAPSSASRRHRWPVVAAAIVVVLAAAELAATHTGRLAGETGRVLELGLFVAAAVGAIVLVTRLRRVEARLETATNEAEALARLAGAAVLVGPEPLSQLVREIRQAFDLTSVAVLEPTKDGWKTITRAGSHAPRRPSEADLEVPLHQGAVVVMNGEIDADDQRLLSAFITQLRSAQEQTKLEERARDAEGLRSANEVRDGLLMAVSHDLRTPLSTIKLSAASLVSEEVHWSDEQVREFARSIEHDADRLNRLVSEVLDLSRLQSGALGVKAAPTDVAAVIAEAARMVPHGEGQVITTVTPPTPMAMADPALLERVVANLVANAVNWSPDGTPVHVHAGSVAGGIEIRVVDRGPGIPPSERQSVFRPFQRLGDGERCERDGPGARSGPGARVRPRHGGRHLHRGHPGRRDDDGRPAGAGPADAVLGRADPTACDARRPMMATRVLLVDDQPRFVAALGMNLCARATR